MVNVFALGILPAHEPVETFLLLLPSVIGGYLVINGLIELKVEDDYENGELHNLEE